MKLKLDLKLLMRLLASVLLIAASLYAHLIMGYEHIVVLGGSVLGVLFVLWPALSSAASEARSKPMPEKYKSAE
ncbi:hypothetical protein [Neptuniibacter sp. QD37_11]|uniref:hypothetical protein n=1 Tax=Neptuniibacter sp. QD37_11 TaxID=3398209 RepID=UPI0039F475C9